ncbi:hypothetical protein H4R33_001659 [Dimargaris cristalligena]|nr:hypothetical protein H4R33_001659 [Dimargaris cristalligena]
MAFYTPKPISTIPRFLDQSSPFFQPFTTTSDDTASYFNGGDSHPYAYVTSPPLPLAASGYIGFNHHAGSISSGSQNRLETIQEDPEE